MNIQPISQANIWNTMLICDKLTFLTHNMWAFPTKTVVGTGLLPLNSHFSTFIINQFLNQNRAFSTCDALLLHLEGFFTTQFSCVAFVQILPSLLFFQLVSA